MCFLKKICQIKVIKVTLKGTPAHEGEQIHAQECHIILKLLLYFKT